MADTYLTNYWLLYKVFIDTFEDITYENIPLALLSNFYHYLSPSLKSKMKEASFSRPLAGQPLDEHQLQAYFDKKMNGIKRLKYRTNQGRLVLHFDYLRFSADNYDQFDSKKTLLLARWKLPAYCGLPVISKTDLSSNHASKAEPCVKSVKARFSALADHPAFQDPFFQEKFLQDIPRFMTAVDAANALFERNNVAAIVVGTAEDVDSRALALTALQRGVTSICLQHGALMGEEAFFPVFCSIQAVFGRYEQDWYLNKGCNKERILITGHPRFDRIFQTSAAGRPSLYRRLRLSPSQKTILIATQPFSSSFYPDLLKKLTAFPDLQMILKPHPWEIGKNQLTDYLHFTKNPRFRLVKKEIELYELLPNVDGVITLTSTVGLEAMLFGKPVWIGDPAGERDYPYYRALGEQVICHPETLAENVQRMLSDPEGLTLAMEKGKRFIQDNYPQHQSAVKLLEVLKDKTGIDFGKNQG